MKKTSKLALKFIMGFTLLGVLICVASSFVGYRQYKASIEQQYHDRAYRCAETVLSYFDPETFLVYVDAVNGFQKGMVTQEELDQLKNTEEYKESKRLIESLRAAMGANDVFAFVLDEEMLLSYQGTRDGWTPLLYIFDSYTEPEMSYMLGDVSSFNPEYINELHSIATTGERSDSYFISKGDYGFNTAAIIPVMNGEQVVAMIAVEIPMTTLQELLAQYIKYAIFVTIALTVGFILLYMLYLYNSVIRPIDKITEKTDGFVKNREEISTELLEIKTGDEIQRLANTVVKMEKDINEYIDNLAVVMAEKERIGAELNVATQIQSDMLPSIFPAFPGRTEFDIYASMTPAKEVGGDFYDFFLVDDDHLAMVMADVSGKGVPSALFMVIAKTLIKNRAQMGGTPGEILGYVNNQLCEGNEAELFVTVWLAILEISTGKGIASNAGHEYPTIRRKDGEFELIKDKHSPVVAAMEGIRFKEYGFELNPGDSLYVYTDGVAEATNANEELFGTQRMLDALNKKPDASPKEILDTVQEGIDAFVGEAMQFDDITMLCLKYFGKGGSSKE